MVRRICYFHEIMNRDDEELTKKVIMSRMERKTKGDFVEQVEGDLKLLNVDKQESIDR